MRRTHSLIHRGYLYAQKRVKPGHSEPSTSELRMFGAKAYRDGYLQARRDAKKGQ
jgi:hypothetical protein